VRRDATARRRRDATERARDRGRAVDFEILKFSALER
jgi:hypothetical protein